jgi:hypothetical protein
MPNILDESAVAVVPTISTTPTVAPFSRSVPITDLGHSVVLHLRVKHVCGWLELKLSEWWHVQDMLKKALREVRVEKVRGGSIGLVELERVLEQG